MACDNPSYINTTNVNQFGFTTVFDAYAKTVTFDISDLTTFKSGGASNITSIVFTVTNSNGSTYTGTINPSVSLNPLVISGLDGGQLFFGQYTIDAVLTEANALTYTNQVKPIVCADNRLNYRNYIEACIEANTDCASATLTIKDLTNKQYAGLSPKENSTTYDVAIIYPKNYLAQKNITFLPYSLSLDGAITGSYQIPTAITVGYDLGCEVTLNIKYQADALKEVECGNGLGELKCCWQDALNIVQMGGTKGAQMQEAMDEASDYFIEAFLLWSSGDNNDNAIKRVKEILNCDCKCQKGVIIQPDPITFGNANIIPACGTSVETDENGDIVISSFVYTVAKNLGDDKITLTTTNVGNCTKQTLIQINCDAIERCIYNILSSDEDILQQWKDLLNENTCACDGVEVTADIQEYYIYTDLEMASLETHYFSRNEKVLASYFDLSTSITGGTIKSVGLYSNLLNNGTTLLAPITTQPVIPTSICASEMISKTNHPAGEVYQILLNVNTECGCDVPFVFDEDIQRVLYSERYGYGYRFNPQIENPPIVVSNGMESDEYYTYYEVIFADSYFSSLGGSLGSSIRSMKIKVDSLGNYSLDETRILFGKKFTGTGSIATENNLWGDQICFDYASAINLDNNEIVNGYPVMYFCTFGGAICRAVRERDTQCNEMANWKIYRIGGEKNVLAGGTQLYGMKTWKIDENGNPTFLVVDNDLTQVKIFYMSTQGSRNDSANWSVQNLFVLGGANANIQVFGDRIYAMGLNQITCYPYIGTDVISELITTSNYTTGDHHLTSGGVVTPNVYTDGAGDLATVDQPLSMWKDGNKYYFSNARDGSNTRGSYIRYFEFNTESPNRPQDYTFYTEILPNSNSNLIGGTWVAGVSSTLSGETFGMVYIAGIGWISIYQYGFRIFNFTTKVCSVFSGQATSGGNLDSIQPIMDSQWTYNVS